MPFRKRRRAGRPAGPPSAIVVLTGAGISAESGVDTFRDKNGIWSKVDYREVATPEGFARDPDLVHEFYNQRRRSLEGIRPNAAHLALAHLEAGFDGPFLLVTQNIDGLHEAAGSAEPVHMHGAVDSALCLACGERMHWEGDMGVDSACPACGKAGGLRPDIVWFGELPYQMERIHAALMRCDLFVSIGTSGAIYPAAGFVRAAREAGARTVELNLERSEGFHLFDEADYGPATEIVPAFVERLLTGSAP